MEPDAQKDVSRNIKNEFSAHEEAEYTYLCQKIDQVY